MKFGVPEEVLRLGRAVMWRVGTASSLLGIFDSDDYYLAK